MNRNTLLACALLAGLTVSLPALGDGISDGTDAAACLAPPVESCDSRCAAGCARVLEDNPGEAMAYYKLAIRALSTTGDPFMPEVDTNLRICSALGTSESARCEILYAALTAYPHMYSIKDRPANPDAGRAWAERAATRDFPEARWALATFLALGAGGDGPDLERAYQLMNLDRSARPERQFALLHAMLLEHGWGGSENLLEADYYSKKGYEWLISGRRILSRTDSVYLDMIIRLAYELGDGRLIHETAWVSTVIKSRQSDKKYSFEALDEILDDEKSDLKAVGDFYGRELLAAKLGDAAAEARIQEIQELLRQYGQEELLEQGSAYAQERMNVIMANREKVKAAGRGTARLKKQTRKSRRAERESRFKTFISTTAGGLRKVRESVREVFD